MVKNTAISEYILMFSDVFAKGMWGHSEDIAYIIYGYENVKTLEKKASSYELLSFRIVSYATAFAIDERENGRTSNTYEAFLGLASTTKTGKTLALPSYSYFPSISMGTHRAYNHQGFYWDYRDKWTTQDSQEK